MWVSTKPGDVAVWLKAISCTCQGHFTSVSKTQAIGRASGAGDWPSALALLPGLGTYCIPSTVYRRR